MLRLVGFFVLVAVVASLLGRLPWIGPLFDHTGIFGLLLVAALISVVAGRVGERLVASRKLRAELRSLSAVGNAHTQGKIGALYLARGRARAALAPLAEAVRGEPDVAEWHYRLGLAHLALRDLQAALAEFERCVEIDEEHAYGAAQLRRAECLQRLGRAEAALEVLTLFERNHGPCPETAFRRGRALRALGRRDQARASFAEVGELARRATRYQRRSATLWALRANWARFV